MLAKEPTIVKNVLYPIKMRRNKYLNIDIFCQAKMS